MTLKDYLAKTDTKLADFAALAGCSPSAISLIANGHRMPNVKLAASIVKATRGKVSMSDLINGAA